MSNPDQCVASMDSSIEFDDFLIIRGGRVYRRAQKEMTLREWCTLMGIDFRTVQKRRQRGASWDDAIDPTLKRKPKPYSPCFVDDI